MESAPKNMAQVGIIEVALGRPVVRAPRDEFGDLAIMLLALIVTVGPGAVAIRLVG